MAAAEGWVEDARRNGGMFSAEGVRERERGRESATEGLQWNLFSF